MIHALAEVGKNTSNVMVSGSRYICLLIVGFSFFSVHSQSVIHEPESVVNLLSQIKQQYKENKKTKGWRIQIINTTNRRALDETRLEFGTYFPKYRATWSYDQPFYKLKVGAFNNKLDAYPVYKAIKREFPSAFLLFDFVTTEEIFEFERVIK